MSSRSRTDRLRAMLAVAAVIATASTLAGCGGSNNNTNSTPVTYNYVAGLNYTVGGTITGLTVSSVVLANGAATVTVGANIGSWTFPSSFAAGSSYAVTVQTQPTGEVCAVTSGGSGTNTGNVGNVTVVCGFGQWNWNAGLNTADAAGVYGALGTGASSNTPGARYGTSSWTDSAGNFWLFGGIGYSAAGGTGYLNDLWEYSPGTRLWTWVNGGNGDNASGVYGTQGTAAAGNVPGARQAASSWTDSSGNFYLFGGVGYGASGSVASLNDLWRYSPTTGQWTWISGSNGDNASGVYGTQGTAAAGNVPGARQAASSWIDSSGNLYLFGGQGYDAAGAAGSLNDLWRYSPSASQWTWLGGSNRDDAVGIYGTQNTAAAGNAPGARAGAGQWIDSAGNLWLFGGYGYDLSGSVGKLNDLWTYSSGSGQWTWVSGEDTANSRGYYDTLGTTAAGYLPGARQSATTWIDASGNLWLFGGVGYDSTGTVGNLNDLWKYAPGTAQWTWVSGGSGHNAIGSYGMEGTGAAGDVPGARYSTADWVDPSGNLWLFGGNGYDASGTLGYLNDLWQYTP